jgi:hypothetical protein
MQHVIVLIIDWWTINIELYVLLIFLIKPLIVHTLIDNYKEYILINKLSPSLAIGRPPCDTVT